MRYLAILIAAFCIAACNRPVADFVIEKEESRSLTAPATVQFNHPSPDADSLFWTFGDGHFSTDSQPAHTYYKSGNYEVSLTAVQNGKSRTKSQRILIAPPKECLVLIKTSMGKIVAELYDETPKHRDNFLKLIKKDFYDSLLFHRVIEGFMIQGGDPESRNAASGKMLGQGGPGYTVSAEFHSDLIHKKGALAAARKGDRVNPEQASSGSQFYIVDGKKVPSKRLQQISMRTGVEYSPQQKKIYREMGGTPFLDGKYTVFGEVIRGMDVIDRMAAVPTDDRDRPVKDILMDIEVIR